MDDRNPTGNHWFSAALRDRTESIPVWKTGAPPIMRVLQFKYPMIESNHRYLDVSQTHCHYTNRTCEASW